MHGFVFYPDGGARPQRQYTGSGVHGYRWSLKAGQKGCGHASHATTVSGYYPKAVAQEWLVKTLKDAVPETLQEQRTVVKEHLLAKVAVEQYYDLAFPLPFGGTNNTAEIAATIECLKQLLADEHLKDCASVVIRQDANYVVDGINQYLPKWVANNFIRADGSQMPNKEHWMKMVQLLAEYNSKEIPLIVQRVDAHSGEPGNTSADQLATIGVFKARELKDVPEDYQSLFQLSEPEGYWAGGLDKKPALLNLRFAYFTAGDEAAKPGEYFLSSQGKDSELTGKKTPDDCYCVVRIASDPILEAARMSQNLIPREIDYYYSVDISNAYGSGFRYLNLYGDQILHRQNDYARHQFVGDVLVTEERHPAYLVGNIFDNCVSLSSLLDEYTDANSPTLQLTDITDSLYKSEQKPVKTKKGEPKQTTAVTTLLPEIVVGYSKHEVSVGYKVNGAVHEAKITLRAGVDFPERNCLKRIEDTHPRVYVLTNWLGGAFMYATVVEAAQDRGIWSGIGSSLRVIGSPKADKSDTAAST